MGHSAAIERVRDTRTKFVREVTPEEKQNLALWTEQNPFSAGFVDGAYINLNFFGIILKHLKFIGSQKVPVLREAEFVREHSGAYADASKDAAYDRLHALGRVFGFFTAVASGAMLGGTGKAAIAGIRP